LSQQWPYSSDAISLCYQLFHCYDTYLNNLKEEDFILAQNFRCFSAYLLALLILNPGGDRTPQWCQHDLKLFMSWCTGRREREEKEEEEEEEGERKGLGRDQVKPPRPSPQ
jgi:hypothetical protein